MSVWVAIDDDLAPGAWRIVRIEKAGEEEDEDQVVLETDEAEAKLPVSEVVELLESQRAYHEQFVGVVGDGITSDPAPGAGAKQPSARHD